MIMGYNYTSNEAIPPVPLMVDAENGNFRLVVASPVRVILRHTAKATSRLA